MRFSEFPEEMKRDFANKLSSLISESEEHIMTGIYTYIRNIAFMNGGALVALLGAMAENKENAEWAFISMIFFCAGLVISALLNIIMYRIAVRFQAKSIVIGRIVMSDTIHSVNMKQFAEIMDEVSGIESPFRKWAYILSILGLVFFILGAVLVFVFGAISLRIINPLFT